MPARLAEGHVVLGADPYVLPEGQKAVFDADLSAEGVIPIQVFLQNRGPRAAQVRRSDFRLAVAQDVQFGPAGANVVAAKFESVGGVVGMTIAFGLIGYLASSSAEDKARAARLADWQSKEFQDVILRTGESAYGFVYFVPPPGTGPFNDATLVVRVRDFEGESSSDVRLPLPGLGFKGAVPKSEPAEGSRP